MSPWGKYYLENFSYNPDWFQPFGSWRMHWMLGYIREKYGFKRKIERHLDILSDILRENSK